MLANEKMASELLQKNLLYIIKNEYRSQKDFAEKMEIAQPTLVKRRRKLFKRCKQGAGGQAVRSLLFLLL